MIGRISWDSKVQELYRVENIQDRISSYSFIKNTLEIIVSNQQWHTTRQAIDL